MELTTFSSTVDGHSTTIHDTQPPMVAAWGCLPPGANVCVAVPANQISSAIRVFLRISDIGGVNWTLRSSTLPLLFISSPSLYTLPSYHYLPLSSPPLKVAFLNPARRSGECYKLSSGFCGGARAEVEFGVF